MSMTTELAQRMKAAALNATGAYERLSMMPEGDIFDISLAEGTQLDADITTLNSFHDEATPANVLELVEALEARDKQITELTEARDLFSSKMMGFAYRVEELEARTVKLPLPRRKTADDYVDDAFEPCDLAAIYNACRLEREVKLKKALAAAGVAVERN